MEFNKIFGYKPVIGMIHLAGSEDEKIKRALEEISIFEEEGIDGAIIENYHGEQSHVFSTLEQAVRLKKNVVLGVNILPNQFDIAFTIVDKFDASFIQLDYIAGHYFETSPPVKTDQRYFYYNELKRQFSNIFVFGGVWPKYYNPIPESILENDIEEAMTRADAIVVTGECTGEETPMDKINSFRYIIEGYTTHIADDFPLVVGAGTNPDNIYEQLKVCDGVIVGSSLKFDNNTRNKLDRVRIRDYMKEVRRAREL